MNPWIFRQTVVNSLEDIYLITETEDIYGFIYKLYDNTSNKVYIGKKILHFTTNPKATQKYHKELKESGHKGRLPKTMQRIKESDWKTYHGSSKPVNALIAEIGEGNIIREMIAFCKNKRDLTYFEMWHVINNNALHDKNYLNEDILGKFHKSKLGNQIL